MARRLFYVGDIRGMKARLRGETSQHLRKVLRAERGQICLVSDRESLWLAEIADIGKDLVEFDLLEPMQAPATPVRVHLAAALVKFDHFEWMLEKATELGVERITPVIAMRSEKGLDQAAPKRMDRWRKILFEAGQQSRRLRPPELHEPVKFNEALALEGASRLFLDEEPGAPPILTASQPAENTVALLVGPEGGWDPRERQAAAQAGWTPVSLGTQILRAETAVIAALAVINAAWLAK